MGSCLRARGLWKLDLIRAPALHLPTVWSLATLFNLSEPQYSHL